MPPGHVLFPQLYLTWLSLPFFSPSVVCAQTSISNVEPRNSDAIIAELISRVDIENPWTANALKDPAYLPAQIGGIVGAYAFCLVLVAITLLALSKKRREHLNGGNDEVDFESAQLQLPAHFLPPPPPVPSQELQVVPNFSYPSPTKTEFSHPGTFVSHSPVSSIGGPGISPFVDQNVVAADKAMAQNQLEEMYKHVMEHEEAKQRGVVYDSPVYPRPSHQRNFSSEQPAPAPPPKKGKSKPASLNLKSAKEDKSEQPRTSSFLSALRSPRKKAMKGISISSPIMTPQSATFPRYEEHQEMTAIPPRHYNPPPPPPVPTDQMSVASRKSRHQAPMTPDISPDSVQSIDERLSVQYGGYTGRAVSGVPTEAEPESAVSEHSLAPLVGLPSSPKPGARFPSLPSSPKPGASFSRPNAPSAVRTGGALPLRAYEPAMNSPSATSQTTTKQTVFERRGPLSPGLGTARTPGTAVPYSPYQPFTPCMPVTPSLVTKEDRKRMKRMVPKTPTLEMVQDTEDVW